MSNPDSPYVPPTEPLPEAVPPGARSPWPLRIVLSVVAVALALPCVCGGALVLLAVGASRMALAERPNVEAVVESYMQKMEAKDANGAYELFSTFAKLHTPPTAVDQLLQEPNYSVFSGYEDATVSTIRVNVTPTKRLATVQGTVTYEGGISGTFSAVLEREEDQWRIQAINVTAPPSKFVRQGK